MGACLVACLIGTGCVTRKPPPPPAVVFPAVPESSLRDLRRLPPGLYDRVEIVTVAAEVGEQFASALKNARQIGGPKRRQCAGASEGHRIQTKGWSAKAACQENHLPGDSYPMI